MYFYKTHIQIKFFFTELDTGHLKKSVKCLGIFELAPRVIKTLVHIEFNKKKQII